MQIRFLLINHTGRSLKENKLLISIFTVLIFVNINLDFEILNIQNPDIHYQQLFASIHPLSLLKQDKMNTFQKCSKIKKFTRTL
jgi:hypothetical protein